MKSELNKLNSTQGLISQLISVIIEINNVCFNLTEIAT